MRTITLLFAAALGASAQTPPASWKDLKFPTLPEIRIPKIDESTLPNGMKLYLLENHELPLVRGTALVRTGNLFDPADKVGLATITGDTIRSGGTSKKTGDQIDEQLENIAASVESSIDESFGRVAFSTMKERTDEVLGIFHDILTDPAFRDNKIQLTKSQLRSSISRRNDDAAAIAQREFTDIVYGRNTPYGWQIEYATLDNIKREDIVAFYKRYYFPANIILAIQGDFSTAEMKAKIAGLFGSWNYTQPPTPPFPAVRSSPKAGIYVGTKSDVTQTNFAIGQLGGTLRDKDYPALEVMGDILGGGFQSRLFQRIRTQLGYAYGVYADWGAGYDHPGVFVIGGSTKSASTADTLKEIDKEVQRIRTTEVSAEELESAKQTVLNGFVFNFDTPSKTLNRLLTYRYYGYPDDFIFQYQKAVEGVTRADILRVAKEYVDPAKFVIVAVGNPKDFGTPLASLNLPVSNLDLTIPEPKAAPKTSADAASLQRGKAMLAKAREAMGGSAKLAGIKDLTQNADVQLDPAAGGIKITQTTEWLAPSHFRQRNVLPFGTITTYSDGKTGWAATPQGVVPIPDVQLRQVAEEMFRLWPSLMLSDANASRTVADAGDGKVEISDKDGNSLLLSLDPVTGLPQSETYASPAHDGDIQEGFSDWRDAGDGVKFPHKIVLIQAGHHYADATVTSIRINQGLSAQELSKKP
jgi:zinc protease